MRKILITLLLIPTLAYSQCDTVYRYYTTPIYNQRGEGAKTIAIFATSIILNAIGDGLNDSGRKTQGHLLNAASIGVLLGSPFVLNYEKRKWAWYLLSYTTLRIGLFDVSYNVTRGLPLNYTGSTSITDKIYNKGGGQPTFPRMLGLVVGISIPINEI